MSFTDGFERRGMEKGFLLGIEATLRIKFGDEGPEFMPEIRDLHDHEVLRKVLVRIGKAASPNDLRRIRTRKRRSKPTEPK